MKNSGNLINVVNYHKCFWILEVLQDINFSVAKNKILCILWKSWSGKTTLLRSIAWLDNDYDWSIYIEWLSVNDYLKKKKVWYITQNYANFPWMTVHLNVIQGIDSSINAELVDKYLADFWLLNFKDYYPNQLSGWMKQRVAIVRALLQNVDLICADEPFWALDHYTRTLAQESFCKLIKNNNKTAIFITHDIVESLIVWDDIIIIKDKGITHINNEEFTNRNTAELRYTHSFISKEIEISKLFYS
jgi:ABC-type nitrate/sulfonate/bicarbonate transport system ATPase subunit